MSIYTDKGYEDRKDYLRTLAQENEVPLEHVLALAELLGPKEDFDGLVSSVQDMVTFGITGTPQGIEGVEL